jgi:hypothetical protein
MIDRGIYSPPFVMGVGEEANDEFDRRFDQFAEPTHLTTILPAAR